jgi:hypothetical protein
MIRAAVIHTEYLQRLPWLSALIGDIRWLRQLHLG